MKRIIVSIILIIAILLSAGAVTLAWFADANTVSPKMSGSILGGYFAGGNGTQEAPYQIKDPIHVYNLAWLQYMGYFNNESDNNGNTVQFYFELINDIDMGGMIIPPIGTTQYPFVGSFNGSNNRIHNFSVSNYVGGTGTGGIVKYPLSQTDLGENASIVGFFGVIGEVPSVSSNITIDSSKNKVYDLIIDDFTVRSDTRESLIGLLAGYVSGHTDGETNVSPISNVAVGDGTIEVGEDVAPLSGDLLGALGIAETELQQAVSLYSLIGACDAHCLTTTQLFINGGQGSDGGQGDAAGWGGSVTIDKLFQDLAKVRGTLTSPGSGMNIGDYAYMATKVMSADGKSYYAVDRITENAGFMFTNEETDKSNYSVVYTYHTLNLDEFVWLAGGAMVTTMTCTPNTDKTVTGNYIKYGDKYLNVELGGGEPSIGLGEDQAKASRWVIENGDLFVLTQGCKLYVNVDDSRNISFHYNENAVGTWSYVDTKGLCYTVNSTNYYFKLIDGACTLQSEQGAVAYYVIKSGNNYLSLCGNMHPSNMQIAENYATNDPNDTKITRWYTSKSEYQTNIYTTIGSSDYALMDLGGSLVVNPQVMDLIAWSFRGDHLYLDNSGYLTFDGSSWGFSQTAPDTPVWQSVTLSDTDDLAWTKGADETLTDMTFSPSSPSSTYNFELGVANENDATYIPLHMNDDHSPTAKNTGYITSGMYNRLNSQPDNGPQSPQFNTGDVRLSNFYSDNIKTQGVVYAYLPGATGTERDYVEISVDGTNDYLKKYTDSVKAYKTLLENERLYGLQFIDGLISEDSLITIPTAVINGTTYTNYQVPADCIDFNLKDEGYINFFAGTYYPETDSFFSLHHVIRDENEKITDIKEIELIYTHTDPSISDTYVYKYNNSDGYSVGSSAPQGATIVFDTSWITDPDLPQDLVQGKADMKSENISGFRGEAFYFEIPVNKGEYALGAVEQRTGATLLYLDIGANSDGTGTTNPDAASEIKAVVGVDFVDRNAVPTSITESSAAIRLDKLDTSSALNATFTKEDAATADGKPKLTVSQYGGYRITPYYRKEDISVDITNNTQNTE